jgi:hypothetical protein
VELWSLGRPSGEELERPPLARVLGFGALGVGAAALVTGIVTGLVAKNKTDELKRECRPRCPRELADDVENASDWAGIATVSFVAAGTGLATGTLLLVLVPAPTGAARITVGARF